MNKYVYKLGEFSGSDYLEFKKGTLVPVGSFFDKIHCMYWTTRFTFSWQAHFKKSLCHSICLKILVLQEENGEK